MFKITNSVFVLISFLVSLNSSLYSATCRSNGNGNWTNTANWTCGSVPTCGDSVIIQAGHTVTITSQQDLRGCGSPFVLVVRGTLRFTNGNKLRLACNSRVYVFTGGSIVPGGGGGNSNELEICNVTMWQAADGIYTGPGCFPSTLAACGAVLPVEIIIFERKECEEGSVCLAWETASERNNDYFQVEQSTDAINYTVIETVKSKGEDGNSTEKRAYEIKDENPIDGISYYRLKQVDFDGTYSYMPLLAVNTVKSKNISLSLFPNPNNGDFRINMAATPINKVVNVILKNSRETCVYKEAHYMKDSSNEIKLNLRETLRPGAYVCLIFIDEVQYALKVLIQ